jgi:hypothetical protein
MTQHEKHEKSETRDNHDPPRKRERRAVPQDAAAVSASYTCRSKDDFDPTPNDPVTVSVDGTDQCFLVVKTTTDGINFTLTVGAYVTAGAPATYTRQPKDSCAVVDSSVPVSNGIDVDAIKAAIQKEFLFGWNLPWDFGI